MLTLPLDKFAINYIRHASPAMRDDLQEIIDMMRLIAPEAELVSDLGIPYFEQNSNLLYGVAARADHLCVYFSDKKISYPFLNRLSHVQFGDNCLIIHRLEDVNLNVLAELFGQLKVHFVMNNRDRSVSIQ
ncbi:DUF1801 domain-containing protein [Marinomonas transparens]|uniref:DUF1801 domain-containing protein n=1 Tax=Marinomonas transparens TaxID=2795388 RepID=A0A934JM40_9GAMM|nr:DUF1801 domain-containing protein [Marinomonas transparens]MBJ7538321.1 DUF1801 domain-containing protein [Marinomonas transparens]